MRRGWVIALIALLAVVLAAANIILGDLNLDEGWYLNAALLVADGKAPYRDFFFTQAPLLPDVYALLSPLWRPFGVLGGRVVTALLGILAALAASAAVRPAVPDNRRGLASMAVFALLACNVYHSYFTVIPKTYALASLMLSLGALAISRIRGGRGWRDALLAAAGGLAFAAAASTRLSLGIVLAVGGLFLLIDARRMKASWFFYGIGGVLGLAAFLLHDALGGFSGFLFANFFHGARSGGGLAMAAGSVSRLARNYMPVALLAAAAILFRRDGFSLRAIPRLALLFVVLFASAFAVHLLSPFPYDDYQVPAMPLLVCAVVSFALHAIPESERMERALPIALLIVVTLAAFTSPLNESWLVVRKDRFWVEMKQEPDIARLRRIGRKIRETTPEDSQLLTTDTYLAVEARRPVPPGFEMGAFGYFPELSDDDARAYHVLNRNLLEEVAGTCDAPCAAFSGYSFALAAPAMTRIADDERDELIDIATRRYKLYVAIPDFGQEHTTLTLWRRAAY